MHMVAIPAIIILLLLLGALAALIVGIFIAKPAVRRVLLWVLVIILLVPVFLVLWVMPMRVARSQLSNSVQPIVITQAAAEVPSVWQDEIEEQFGARVYSSPQAAAFGLGKQIADKHRKLLGRQLEIIQDPQSPKAGPVKVILCEDTANMERLEQCRNGLKQTLSDLDVLIQSRASSGPSEGQVWIVFDSQDEPKAFNVDFVHPVRNAVGLTVEGNQTGVIEAVIQTHDDKFAEQTHYDYRWWIHDMPGFRSQYDRAWLAVYSDTATDLKQAQKQTYEKACSILIHSITASGYPPTDVLKENIEQFGLVADSYSQELKGMTGPVWRFALLLDTDSSKLTELVRSKAQVVHHQRSSWAQMGLSLLGMIVIIWIAYSVANAATKGYYSVLFAVLAILAAVIVGVLLFIA